VTNPEPSEPVIPATVAEYIFRFLADRGVRDVFLVTGGGAMFLNDALRREERIRPVACHHEQAVAMAAEGYARVSGGPGVACVTTGPGGINALNGVFGAWTDSIPMIVLSGQVKREMVAPLYPGLDMRQLGDQEADIVRMVSGITKYAVRLDDPSDVATVLDRAWAEATSGSPGPVWIDVPIDVQSARIDPSTLRSGWVSPRPASADAVALRTQARDVASRLRHAQRPVLLAGNGIRLAGALDAFRETVQRLGIPTVTAWTHDLLPSDDPQFCGRQGSIGTRAGNLTVQNADFLLVVGARLTVRQVGYNWQAFAQRAFKAVVDIDPAELKRPIVSIDLPIRADAGDFLRALNAALDADDYEAATHQRWLAWCHGLLERFPGVLPHQRSDEPPINAYAFVEDLFDNLADDDVVVCGNATATIVPFQVARIRANQRLFSNSGSASMGYDLPAAIGAAIARRGARVVCLAGDGSLQFNVQELQTIRHHSLPIKLFVLDNDGYLSIRSTQRNFFGDTIGSGREDGVSLPDPVKLAEAYGLPAVRLVEPRDTGPVIRDVLASEGPIVCHVRLDPAQEFEPRIRSRSLPDGTIVSPALEDMYPFLEPDELAELMRGPGASEPVNVD
jgi:acetolactate synthase-1/2/3 large subunit